MVVDPVCGMKLEPADAVASAVSEGTRFYFCSDSCQRRFLANPAAYRTPASSPQVGHRHSCSVGTAHVSWRLNPGGLGIAVAATLTATIIMLGFYFGILTLVSGWSFTVQQFNDYWLFIVALAVGFGIQVGLFSYLHRAVHSAASGKVMVATGATSGAAMVSCCTHYLVNLLPVLGATGIMSFVGQYQVELFWFGIASNLAGIAYIGRRVVSLSHGA